jgi:hypothetical protein
MKVKPTALFETYILRAILTIDPRLGVGRHVQKLKQYYIIQKHGKSRDIWHLQDQRVSGQLEHNI